MRACAVARSYGLFRADVPTIQVTSRSRSLLHLRCTCVSRMQERCDVLQEGVGRGAAPVPMRDRRAPIDPPSRGGRLVFTESNRASCRTAGGRSAAATACGCAAARHAPPEAGRPLQQLGSEGTSVYHRRRRVGIGCLQMDGSSTDRHLHACRRATPAGTHGGHAPPPRGNGGSRLRVTACLRLRIRAAPAPGKSGGDVSCVI